MSSHCWIEWRKPGKLAVFGAALMAIALYWSYVAKADEMQNAKQLNAQK
jgi:hypothetical protein